MTEIPHQVLANVLGISQVLQLILESRPTEHRCGGITGLTGALDFSEREAIAVPINGEAHKISSRQTRTRLPSVSSVRPREAARAVFRQIRLGNGLTDSPIFESLWFGKDFLYFLPREFCLLEAR